MNIWSAQDPITMKHHKDSFHAISKLFDESTKRGIPLKVCAPMVRYSSLPFRHLVKLYKCDLTFTHMMLADCFSKVCLTYRCFLEIVVFLHNLIDFGDFPSTRCFRIWPNNIIKISTKTAFQHISSAPSEVNVITHVRTPKQK